MKCVNFRVYQQREWWYWITVNGPMAESGAGFPTRRSAIASLRRFVKAIRADPVEIVVDGGERIVE